MAEAAQYCLLALDLLGPCKLICVPNKLFKQSLQEGGKLASPGNLYTIPGRGVTQSWVVSIWDTDYYSLLVTTDCCIIAAIHKPTSMVR